MASLNFVAATQERHPVVARAIPRLRLMRHRRDGYNHRRSILLLPAAAAAAAAA